MVVVEFLEVDAYFLHEMSQVTFRNSQPPVLRLCLSEFEYEGATVMMAPAAGFYTTPGAGINEVRIAYVLKKKDLQRALVVLRKALELYPGRTLED